MPPPGHLRAFVAAAIAALILASASPAGAAESAPPAGCAADARILEVPGTEDRPEPPALHQALADSTAPRAARPTVGATIFRWVGVAPTVRPPCSAGSIALSRHPAPLFTPEAYPNSPRSPPSAR